MKYRIIIGVLLVFGLVTGCSSPEAQCESSLEAYMPALDKAISSWNDAFAVAESTSRISLADPVSRLQDARRDVESLEPPDCYADRHESLVESMDYTIETFLNFMSDADYDFQDEAGRNMFLSVSTIELVAEDVDTFSKDQERFMKLLFTRLEQESEE